MGFLIFSLIFGALLVLVHTKGKGVKDTEFALPMKIFTVALWVIVGIVTTYNAIIIVPVGSTYAGYVFGEISQEYFTEGPHVVNPFMSFEEMSIRRQIVEFQSKTPKQTDDSGDDAQKSKDENADDVTAISSNNLPLTIDVTYAFRLNPKFAWWIFRNIGDDDAYYTQLIQQTARNASRNAAAHFTDTEATTTKRDELARTMEEQFNELLVAECKKLGLSEQDAEHVFQVLPVQLRKVLPPKKVLNSIAEKAAAEQDLQRQSILTDIAAQEALRRENEGMGVSNLFSKLPKDFTAGQISQVLGALADKERADATLKAVETGSVSTLILSGGGQQPAISVPSGAK